MLPGMIEGWMLWLVLVGLAVGAVATWLLMVRLPRDEIDVDADERRVEAAWIAATIERHGGIAPHAFVEEVLELHQAYLRTPDPSVHRGEPQGYPSITAPHPSVSVPPRHPGSAPPPSVPQRFGPPPGSVPPPPR